MKANKTPKHGVFIKEGRTFNIKIIYNKGHVMARYRNIPKKNHFKSTMVNDFNQHLCEGWFMAEMNTMSEVKKHVIQRVLDGKKPMGEVHVSNIEQAKSLCKKFNPKKFFCKFREFTHPNPENNFEVVFGVRGKLCEIFDLEELKKDYAYFRDIVEDIESKKDRNLSNYAYCWDIDEGAELWETGLILGYPIENTISLYYRDRFKS